MTARKVRRAFRGVGDAGGAYGRGMRLLGLLILIVGGVLIARPWLPVLPFGLPGWPTGAALALIGLVLLARPRRAAPVAPDRIAEDLTARGFTFADEAHGWRARGDWRGRAIEIRRVRGYEASRFGLEWIVEITVRGTPAEPWPLPPAEARCVDRRDHGVSVALPAISRPEGAAGFAAQVDAVLAQVAPERTPG